MRVDPSTPASPLAVGSPAPAPASLTPMALATLLIGILLPTVDFFIVNVTLPTMAQDLGASDGLLELVIAGYAVAYAVLLVSCGRVGDARGRRRLFVWGMAAFTITSLLCGLAPTIELLVAARVLQGAAASLMVPQVLSTIQATGGPASRARALGWVGAAGGLSAVVGQVLGGALVSADVVGTGWRPVFLVNVPLGLVGIWLATRHLPETRSPRPAPPDRVGSLVLALAVLALLVPLTEGRAMGWPAWSWVLLVVAPVLGLAFVMLEHRLERAGEAPLVPPSLLRVPSLRQGLALVVALYTTFGAFMFVYALAVQGGLDVSAVRAGLVLSPMATGYLVSSLQMARLVERYGGSVVTAGALVQLVGLGLLAIVIGSSWPHLSGRTFAAPLLLMGLGQGLMMPAAMRLALSDVPLHAAGAGSGVLTTTQQVALAFGVAGIGSLFLTLSSASHLGMRDAFLAVVALQALVAAGVALGSRRLPRAR